MVVAAQEGCERGGSAAIPDAVAEAFRWLDSHHEEQVEVLRRLVGIESVSSWPVKNMPQLLECLGVTKQWLENLLDFAVELREAGCAGAPPVLLGKQRFEDPGKKTLLVYGHVDVMPAKKADGWDTEPFELVRQSGGQLVGRGASDDKGPVLSWINALHAIRRTGNEAPVNVRFLLEAMEESGSEGLEQLLTTMQATKDSFLRGVDFCAISDSYWLGTKKPCLTFGLRGCVKFRITVKGASRDQHSGTTGGMIFEPMADLCWLLSQLTDSSGRMIIPRIFDQVIPMTKQERESYAKVDFDMESKRNQIGFSRATHSDPADLLAAVWRHPWLSIHGIEGAFWDSGFKTVIPGKVTGKFSIRTVPNMSGAHVEEATIGYLKTLWHKRNSSNAVEFECIDKGDWYYVDPLKSANFAAAQKAICIVHNVEPDLIREGGSIPIALILARSTGADVCLIPIGRSDDGAHSQNEKIDLDNYVNGAKVMVAYLWQLALTGRASNEKFSSY